MKSLKHFELQNLTLQILRKTKKAASSLEGRGRRLKTSCGFSLLVSQIIRARLAGPLPVKEKRYVKAKQ
jgi:hypothetical protein